MPRWRSILAWLTVPALIAGGIVGYTLVRQWPAHAAPTTEPAASDSPPSDSVRVNVVHPKRGSTDRTTRQPGSVQAFESVQLYAGVSGFLKSLSVDIGDRIKKGQSLAKVDVPELEKQVQHDSALVDQALSRVQLAKARAKNARAELAADRAAVPRAEAMLKAKSAELRYQQQRLQRTRELAALHSIEDKLVDEYTSHRDAVREAQIAAQESVTSAKATVDAMSAKVEAADADVAEAQAEVNVAQAELQKAQVMLQYASVVAPFDGVVTQRNFFPNDFVRAAHEGGAVPILVVQRTDLMRVVVQVPDPDVPFCDPGDPAIVEIGALPGVSLPRVKVSRIAQSEDPETRLMRVEIDLPNPTGRICNGMYGWVTIILQHSSLLAVPSSSLVGKARNGKSSIYVVHDSHVQLVPVEIGTDNGVVVEIIKGVKADDAVVVDPGSGIHDGATVSEEWADTPTKVADAAAPKQP